MYESGLVYCIGIFIYIIIWCGEVRRSLVETQGAHKPLPPVYRAPSHFEFYAVLYYLHILLAIYSLLHIVEAVFIYTFLLFYVVVVISVVNFLYYILL